MSDARTSTSALIRTIANQLDEPDNCVLMAHPRSILLEAQHAGAIPLTVDRYSTDLQRHIRNLQEAIIGLKGAL